MDSDGADKGVRMKIEDLTLKEIKEICEKRMKRMCHACWVDCPIERVFKASPCPYKWTTEDLKREVEDGERNSKV